MIKITGGHFLVVPPRLMHRGVHDVRTPSTITGLVFNPQIEAGWRNSVFTELDLQLLITRLKRSPMVAIPFGREVGQVIKHLKNWQRTLALGPRDRLLKTELRAWACVAILGAIRELATIQSEQPEVLVEAAKQYLRDRLGDPLRMPDLVSHIGLGRTRFFELFKVKTGMTPNDFLTRLRIERAEEMLADASASLTDIAMACGFNSSQYFSNVFRQHTGQTPLAFRNATK